MCLVNVRNFWHLLTHLSGTLRSMGWMELWPFLQQLEETWLLFLFRTTVFQQFPNWVIQPTSLECSLRKSFILASDHFWWVLNISYLLAIDFWWVQSLSYFPAIGFDGCFHGHQNFEYEKGIQKWAFKTFWFSTSTHVLSWYYLGCSSPKVLGSLETIQLFFVLRV